MIGIIVAMESELSPYLEYEHTIDKVGEKSFYHLQINNRSVVVVLSGIGKVNSTYATTLLIYKYHPSLIISTGVSGGLGICNVLDIVVGTATCQHDVDTSALGDPIGYVSTVNKIYFGTSKEISQKFCDILNCKKGVLACGDQFISDSNLSKSIVSKFDAIACDMESGAIGQICYIEKVPYVVIRCISDGAGENAGLSFNNIVERASDILGNGVLEVIKSLG
jgi:adenosylhomocysteine nucleosidase